MKYKYTVNEDYFKNYTLENCYWAGFIAADGNINQSFTALSITLSERDNSHLEKFRQDIQYTGVIHKRSQERSTNKLSPFKHGQYNFSRLNISRKKICEDLFINFNITPAKSKTLQIPNLKGDLLLAYIIGFLDGDGYISTSDNNRIEFGFTSGCIGILEFIQNVVDNLVPVTSKIYHAKVREASRNNSVLYTYKVTGQRAYKILSSLDKINVPKLQRKWDKLKICHEAKTTKQILCSTYSTTPLKNE